MRKSIKKIAASLLAATMVLGTMTSAFGYQAADGLITDIDDGETVYLAVGNMTGTAWDTKAENNVMKPVEGVDGVIEYDMTIPAKAEDDSNLWAIRFAICQNYSDDTNYVAGGWSRILLGEAGYKANDSFTCLTNIRLVFAADTAVKAYYDTRTATLYVEDADGNPVDYYVSWTGNDDDETYSTVSELAAMTYDEYYAAVSDDRKADLDKIQASVEDGGLGLTLSKSLFKGGSYAANVEGLANYIKTGTDYVVPAEDPADDPKEDVNDAPAATTPAATTPAATTPAATTAAATTAANQATKTGDVAPVALMVVLFAAVAVVAVVAKKKEA